MIRYLPSQHGFDEYLGIPFSADNGISSWQYFNSSFGGGASAAFHQTPLPLMQAAHGGVEKVIEQPADLATLTQDYVDAASDSLPCILAVLCPIHVVVPPPTPSKVSFTCTVQ